MQVESAPPPLVVNIKKLDALISSSSFLMNDVLKDGTEASKKVLQKAKEKLAAARQARGSVGEAMVLQFAVSRAFTQPDVRHLTSAIDAAEKAGVKQESISAASTKLQSVQSLLAVENMAGTSPIEIEVCEAACDYHGMPLLFIPTR